MDFLIAKCQGRFNECEMVNIKNILNIDMKTELLAGYLFCSGVSAMNTLV